MIYHDNLFYFADLSYLRWFQRTVLPQRMNQIRSIWVFLAVSFPGDRFSQGISPNMYDTATTSLCQTLKMVRGLKEVSVYIHWKEARYSSRQHPRDQGLMLAPFYELKWLRTFRISGPFNNPLSEHDAARSPFEFCTTISYEP